MMESIVNQGANKPTLYQLCRLHHVDLQSLARVSQIHPLLVWDLLINNRVDRDLALAVITGLNTLRGTSYRLSDLAIALKEESKDPTE